jgi:NADH:ubiquinone oxidoreductase subunit 5 (subunit L)/multisubunit Na+/H+ antiporter MnhA subunit
MWSVWVLYIGALLSAVYLLQVPFAAFSGKSEANTTKPPFAMNLAVIICTALTLGFGLFYGEILDILRVL